MVNDEKIKQYIRWFDNLSFFGNDSFILEQIENFWNLVNLSGKAFYPFDKLFLRGIDYSNITLDETIILAQRFFDIHNIKINIKELISENILILELENKDEKDDFYNIHVDGQLLYGEQSKKSQSMSKR